MGLTQVPTGGPCRELAMEAGRILKLPEGEEKSKMMSQGLQMIVQQDCMDELGYWKLVEDFCKVDRNFTYVTGVGRPGEPNPTCQTIDFDGVQAAVWCMKKDKSGDYYPRMKTRKDVCNEKGLKSKWHETAAKYCRTYPEDDWCRCYNVKENKKICDGKGTKYGPDAKPAAGCDLYDRLEESKVFYKDGYNILKDNMYCTRKTCSRPKFQYIPKGGMDNCKTSYKFCGKDINIVNTSSSDMVLACNEGMSDSEKPEWWDEESDDDSWLNEVRQPPFDKFPLNKLPITEFPEEFDWEDDNVKNLTYFSVGSISLCCICMIMIRIFLKSRQV